MWIEFELFLQISGDLRQTVFDVMSQTFDVEKVEAIRPHEIVGLWSKN